ncbi:response regulator [Agrobacterium larrymoorei]|uniref:response regulator n=1 Tax=Agrobacterium larrymoorei TaxID=160699 RepID=UPI001573924D|nr:response regulator [Agrobacterium larrymoorei]NTJ43650.1 response regulator [Agrobacterium larrymoorei]
MPKSLLLIVEDDGLIRMDLVDMLTDAGFRVLDAGNADQALAILEREPAIAALMTDIDMPGSMNGLRLAQHTAKHWPDCKIIVISGRYSPMQGSMPEGALFLSKPISEIDLEKALNRMEIAP